MIMKRHKIPSEDVTEQEIYKRTPANLGVTLDLYKKDNEIINEVLVIQKNLNHLAQQLNRIEEVKAQFAGIKKEIEKLKEMINEKKEPRRNAGKDVSGSPADSSGAEAGQESD